MARLSDPEIQEALTQLPGWKREGDALVKKYHLESFRSVMALVVQVADHAERVEHHPDIVIEYRDVTFRCWTHTDKGISARDVSLARQIETLATEE